MDPLTVFVTIVQLLGMFVGERRHAAGLKKQDFLDWLATHRHDELKLAIEGNQAIAEGVQHLLEQNQAALTEKLDDLQLLSGEILSRVKAFEQLAAALPSTLGIDKESIELLQAFYDSPAEWMILQDAKAGFFQFSNDLGVKFENPRFAKDDIATLARLGLVSYEETPGTPEWPKYRPTRAGAAFVKRLRAEA